MQQTIEGARKELEELQLYIPDWQICAHCRVIDNDHGRVRSGHKCGTCGGHSDGGEMYFPSNVGLIVDLITEAYTTEPKVENPGSILEYEINCALSTNTSPTTMHGDHTVVSVSGHRATALRTKQEVRGPELSQDLFLADCTTYVASQPSDAIAFLRPTTQYGVSRRPAVIP